MAEIKQYARKWLIGIVGAVVLVVGIIAIPYPGPGWLIVFTGLAILASEFTWAQQVLKFAKTKYDAWETWLKRQSFTVRAIFWLLTCAVVAVTLWLLNVYGYMNDFLGIGWDWLHSPLPWY